MGVMVAYPSELQATDVDFVHVGDTLELPPGLYKPPAHLNPFGYLSDAWLEC